MYGSNSDYRLSWEYQSSSANLLREENNFQISFKIPFLHTQSKGIGRREYEMNSASSRLKPAYLTRDGELYAVSLIIAPRIMEADW